MDIDKLRFKLSDTALASASEEATLFNGQNAAEALLDTLISGDVICFMSYLSDSASLVLYGERTIHGKTLVSEFWMDWRKQSVLTIRVTDFEVKYNYYFSHSVLLYQDAPRLFTADKHMLIVPVVKGAKIETILMVPRHLNSSLKRSSFTCPFDDLYGLPMRTELVQEHSVGLSLESYDKANRIPCPSCGQASENLEWHHFKMHDEYVEYSGVISICPDCNRVIEVYPEEERYLGRSERGMIYHKKPICSSINNGNEFSKKAFQFHNILQTRTIKKRLSKNRPEVFKVLSELSLPKGYSLRLELPRSKNPINVLTDLSTFYLYNAHGETTMDVIAHLDINATAMAAWEVFLLATSPTIMPVAWHGGYIRRKFILNEVDVEDIEMYENLTYYPLKGYDVSEILKMGLLLPSVVIENDIENNLFIAHVYCTFWNDWKGLFREHVQIIISDGKVKEFDNVGDLIIHPYNCGILF